MTNHRPILTTNEIYHVFNRTIGKEIIFQSNRHIYKFLEIINYYRFKQSFSLSKYLTLDNRVKEEIIDMRKNKSPLVEVLSYSLMPNHFHFLLKQIQDKGISHFISNIQNSFAKYYNLKFTRVGGLFQSSFKSKRIKSFEELIHVSRYIHLNPVTSYLIDFSQLKNDPRTSLHCYLQKKTNSFVSTNLILSHFKNINRYLSFIENQIDYQQKLKKIKDLLID